MTYAQTKIHACYKSTTFWDIMECAMQKKAYCRYNVYVRLLLVYSPLRYYFINNMFAVRCVFIWNASLFKTFL